MRAVVACFLASLAISAMAQTPPRVAGVRLAKPPVIDGTVDAAEWSGASTFENFIDPVTGKAAPDPTTSYVAYDDQAIYVAVVAHDPKPEGIVGREVTPGADFDGEDTVTFRINTFGTRSWDGLSRFTVNVLNTQSESISGGRAAKREWRGQWQSATKRLPDGWCAEFRIPWRILEYPAGTSLSMDFQIERWQARTRVGSAAFNATTNNRPDLFAIWTGVAPPVRKRPLEFLAYTAPEVDDGKFSLRAGLDLRAGITSTVTGLVSVAPDFRNIEEQVAGIGFTRTERYLNDARPFFNEGEDFFSLTEGFTFGRMFYSRRIDVFDVGTKVYGKLSPSTSVGILGTFRGGETAGVARVEKTFGPKANVSLFGTSYDRDGVQNLAHGGTFFVRRGSFNVDGQIAMERNRNGPADMAGAMALAYEVPNYFAILRYESVDPNFAPALGYIPWTDRRGAYLYAETWREHRSGPLRSLNYNVFATDFRTFDGQEQQRGFDPFVGFSLRNDMRFGFGMENTSYYGQLDRLFNFDFTVNSSNRYKRFGGFLQTGKRGDVNARFIGLGGSYRTLKKLDLGLEYNYREDSVTERQLIGTASYEFSPTRSISTRVVQVEGDTNAYLAFRSAGGAGTDYFLILGDPNARTWTPRLSIKVVWAF